MMTVLHPPGVDHFDPAVSPAHRELKPVDARDRLDLFQQVRGDVREIRGAIEVAIDVRQQLIL
jgi:hypothetical protein